MHEIVDAERDAALEYLDRFVSERGGRRGRAQTRVATGGLIWATSRHATTRAGDPQVHDLLIANAVFMRDARGGWKGADTAFLRDHLHAATAVGRMAAAAKAVELGYGIVAGRAHPFEPATRTSCLRGRPTKRSSAASKSPTADSLPGTAAAMTSRPVPPGCKRLSIRGIVRSSLTLGSSNAKGPVLPLRSVSSRMLDEQGPSSSRPTLSSSTGSTNYAAPSKPNKPAHTSPAPSPRTREPHRRACSAGASTLLPSCRQRWRFPRVPSSEHDATRQLGSRFPAVGRP
jgi:hypothetical protein